MTKKEEKRSFEDNIMELEKIVHELESGDIKLDDALSEFNRAYELSKECDTKLKEARESVNKILNKDGTLTEFKIEEKE